MAADVKSITYEVKPVLFISSVDQFVTLISDNVVWQVNTPQLKA